MLGRIFKKTDTIQIFADLVVETADGRVTIDVERSGWLEETKLLRARALRLGLLMRGEKEPRLWMRANGAQPAYLSRVVGEIWDGGQRQMRVAGLYCGEVYAWLHADGTVEVAKEPTKDWQ